MTDIWCHFFIDGPKTNTREKLETIRAIIARSDKEDILIYNYWAHKVGVPPIALHE